MYRMYNVIALSTKLSRSLFLALIEIEKLDAGWFL